MKYNLNTPDRQLIYSLMKCIERLTADDVDQWKRDHEAEWIGNAHEHLIQTPFLLEIQVHNPGLNQSYFVEPPYPITSFSTEREKELFTRHIIQAYEQQTEHRVIANYTI